ncbi:MAG: UPF0104 family protein [Acidimicrobiales bacterium]|nr:UPF0104 family protein [Acidimicrobiales bacterium]
MNRLLARARTLLARVPRSAVRATGALLAVATAAFVVVEVVDQWDGLVDAVTAAEPWWLVASFAAFALAEAGYALVWPATLGRAGHPVPPGLGGATFLVTQTAKFVPGSVWQHVGRVGTSPRLGVPKRVTAGALLVEVGASVAAALFLAGLLGTAGPLLVDDVGPVVRSLEVVAGAAALLIVPLLASRAGARVAGGPLLSSGGLAAVVGLHVAVWAGYGSAAALLSVGLDGPFLPTVGAFCLSWVAGLVVVGAPAGLGVREAVMAAALTPVAGADVALAVTIGSRALWTAVQLLGAGLGLGYLARRGGPTAGEPVAAARPEATGTADPPSVPC